MKLSEQLVKLPGKKYDPLIMIEMKFKGNDVAIKTDKDGNAILFFIGNKTVKNTIKGERHAPTLKHDQNGILIKDH